MNGSFFFVLNYFFALKCPDKSLITVKMSQNGKIIMFLLQL